MKRQLEVLKPNDNYRRLVKVRVIWDGAHGWVLSYDGGQKIFHGDLNQFALFLGKLKASDNATTPRSVRSITFLKMAQEIQAGTDRTIWIWSNILKGLNGTVFKA